MRASEKLKQDTKWVFFKKGTCSRTQFYILDQHYNNPLEEEETASDPLAGGIMQHGYQCGHLFGTVLSVGAIAYKLSGNVEEAIPKAINISQKVEKEFKSFAGSSDCLDLTKTDFSKGKQMAKYMLSGKFYSCFKLADRWAPHAIKFVEKAFEETNGLPVTNSKSCASETVKRMGANEKEQSIVAGLSGGVGLSGNACGALSAAIWYRTLQQIREGVKPGIKNPEGDEIIEVFLEATDYEFKCDEICGRKFETAEDHGAFIEDGGCEDLIERLST